MKSRNLNFLEPSGHLEPVMGLIYLQGGDTKISLKHKAIKYGYA